MTNSMKSRFLVATAALLAGVGLASAQGPGGGGAASEKGMSAGSAGHSGSGMSQGAPGGSRSEGMTQGRRSPDIRGEPDRMDTRIEKAAENRSRFVRRTVLDRNELPVAEALANETCDALAKKWRGIIDRHQNRHARRPHCTDRRIHVTGPCRCVTADLPASPMQVSRQRRTPASL